MSQHYSDPSRESETYALPDVEVFYITPAQAANRVSNYDDGTSDDCTEPGWYFWYCFPGCMPDSEPMGPYATEAEAVAAAQEGNE
jgi:hypothetical protein